MKPRELDYLINGVKVYIYKRPSDGKVYASAYDFERFNVKPIEIMRVKTTDRNYSVETCPIVAAKVAALQDVA